MDLDLAIGLALGVTGATFLNVGKGIQKLKVQVLTRGRDAFRPPHRRDLAIWSIGSLMTSSAGICFSLAFARTNQTSLVAAMTGVGLVALLIFSATVLKEKVGAPEIAGVALVIAGTVTISLLKGPASAGRFEIRELMLWTGAVLGLWVLPLTYTMLTGRFHGTIFGALAGTMSGISMTLGDIAMIVSKGSFWGQFRGPYVYLALIFGTTAMVLTQVAFFRGRAVVVVPCFSSFVILVPMLLERGILGVTLGPGQTVGLLTIIAGIVLMTTTHDLEPAAREPRYSAKASSG